MYHEVKSLAREKVKKIGRAAKRQPNMEAVSWLLKPLKLEANSGFANRAVAGGVQAWLPRLQDKLIQQADLSQEQATALLAPLNGYDQAQSPWRKQAIQSVVKRFHELQKNEQTSKPSIDSKQGKPASHDQLPAIQDSAMTIQYLKGVGPHRARLFKRLGIETIDDLIHFYPRDWQDRSQVIPINQVKTGQMALIVGQVKAKGTFNVKRGLNLTKIVIEDQSGRLDATWFNQPYIKDKFEVGQMIIAFGKVEFYRGWQIAHPDCELLDEQDLAQVHVGRIVPIYSLTDQLSQRVIRQLMAAVLKALTFGDQPLLADEISRSLHLLPSGQAIRQIHFPDNLQQLQQARHTLVYEELILQQMAIFQLRQTVNTQSGQPLCTDGPLLTNFLKKLPFELTTSQHQAKTAILGDLGQAKPMHRLLQGDVGSGKTVIAMMAALAAVDTGLQAAFMAPTEILAYQHFQSIKLLTEPLGIKLALLTSGMKAKDKTTIYQALSEGDVQVVIGTHALTQSHIRFKRLGLTIIDEQHRFGVEQRQLLREKGKQSHVLVMTATPIPRTLALTVYGDLDVTIINELPPGRQPITTKWLKPKQAQLAYQAVSQAVKAGRQAYIIFPLIDESEKMDLKALTVEIERLSKFVFPQCKLGLLHGKLKSVEKDKVMHAFKSGKLDILASTTVVEVGVDVPNATIMVIEDADRFGLAALHQLRGRVGRGRYPSSCFLIAQPKTDEGKARMAIMEKVKDGFLLSEKDLALRGPGEFFGLRQHGLPDLKLANLIQDADKIEQARAIVQAIIKEDPELKQAKHEKLKKTYQKIYFDKTKHAQTA